MRTAGVALAALVLAGAPASAADTPLALEAVRLDFGKVNVGNTSPSLAATVTNTGASPFGPINAIGGGTAVPFSAVQNCAGVTLGAGASCSFFYSFSPGELGVLVDESVFSLGLAGEEPEGFRVLLRGEGAIPFDVAPLCMVFGEVGVGLTSAPMTAVVQNVSDETFGPIAMTVGAAANPAFGAAQNCAGANLAPLDSCSIFYTFTPNGPGPFGAEAHFTIGISPDPAEGVPFDVVLAGCGAGAPCPAVCECPPSPSDVCVEAGKASLKVDEGKEGKERLAATLSRFAEETAQGDFGDPVDGVTRHLLCLYDGVRQLAGELVVARAGGSCGFRGDPCWQARRTSGWSYKDPVGAADGVRQIRASSGPAGRGKLAIRASNQLRKGQTALPLGIAARLAGSPTATVQLHASDARCYSAELDASGNAFKK